MTYVEEDWANDRPDSTGSGGNLSLPGYFDIGKVTPASDKVDPIHDEYPPPPSASQHAALADESGNH